MGIYRIHHQLYSHNRRHRRMFVANIIFVDIRANITATDINRGWSYHRANIIRQYYRTKINVKNIKPVNPGNLDKPGCMGNDLGCCRHVFQRAIIGWNLYHMRPI